MANNKQQYVDLHSLLILKLNSLLYIEQALIKALPKMARAASDQDLADAFEMHLDETKNQATRLEDALKALGEKSAAVEVAAIDGLVTDAEWCIKNVTNPDALDALLIAAAQYVERYESAGYGTAYEWAKLMEHDEVASLLEESLSEEKAANDKLTAIAEGGVNQRANIAASAETEVEAEM